MGTIFYFFCRIQRGDTDDMIRIIPPISRALAFSDQSKISSYITRSIIGLNKMPTSSTLYNKFSCLHILRNRNIDNLLLY